MPRPDADPTVAAAPQAPADATTPAGPPAGPAADRSAPERVGRYQILGELARGGMGVVYRARDTDLDRDVAVKLIQDRYPADSPAARRFLEEARIAGQLQHPGVPPVHEAGRLPDGRPFLAM